MLQADTPEDFVIVKGKTHTMREFVEASASELQMDLV